MINTTTKRYLLSRTLDEFFMSVHNAFQFVIQYFRQLFKPPFHLAEMVNQCFEIGLKALPLITLTGFIVGVVFTKQSRPPLEDFGATSWLPSLIGIAVVKAMGPLVTALICAGKVGSGMGAELGSMKVTEQIDAMEVSSTNPIRFLVVTRVWAATLMIPLLILYADGLGILGSWAGANIKGSVSFVLFFSQAFHSIEFIDFVPAFIKSFFFGLVIGLVGCYKGYNAGRGTESVGKAANSAVVLASLLVLIVDVIAVQITDMIP